MAKTLHYTYIFRDGFIQGRQGYYRAINIGNQVKEDVIVDIVRRKNGRNRKSGYKGKAEYFAVYSPDTGKIYMISVDQAVDGNMNLRFKSAGVIRSNGRQNWRVSYEEAVASGVKYNWAEDYEI